MKKNNLSTVIIFLGLVIFLIVAIACTHSPHELKTNYSASETTEILNNASSITVNSRFSLGKYYEISVDDEIVAIVKGKPFRLIGDTFTMYSTNGEIIGSEKEEVWHLNHQATFRDANGDVTFYMSSKYISIGNKFNLCDADGNLVGRSEEEIFHLLRENNYYNANDELVWTSKAHFNLIFGTYDLIRVSDADDTLGSVNLVFLNCIEDAIESSKSSSNSSNNSN